MVKVPIEFYTDFTDGEPTAIPVGRLCLGDDTARIYFGTDGKLFMVCPESARNSIVFLKAD